jgi:hypothetical protein
VAFTARTSRLHACTKVLAAVAAALAALTALTIVDFPCDTDSTRAPHLPALQNGKFVDSDVDLLMRAADMFHPAPVVITT